MLDLGYMKVFKIENPSESVKETIKTLTNNPEKVVGNVETIKILKDIIKKAEELKK